MATRFAFPRFGDVRLDTEAAAARHAIVIPTLLAAFMLMVGFTTARMAGIDNTSLFAPYVTIACIVTVLSAWLYIFIAFARLALKLADNPCARVWEDVRARAPLLLLPMLVFPLFLAGYTSAKTSIPFLVGYRWDAFWSHADVLVFGDDAWKIAHSWLGTSNVKLWEMLYTVAWGLGLLLFKSNVALYASPRRVGVIFTAMLLTWMIGGWLMAYLMSATGPIFAHLVDTNLGEHYAPLRSELDALLTSDSSIRLTQDYLAKEIDSLVAVKGGGISAMPSMHIGAVTIAVLSARGTRWLIPAIAFWITIFVGSAYFGYHYWVDGIVAALVACVAWKIAEACFPDEQPDEPGNRRRQSLFGRARALPVVVRRTLFQPRAANSDSEHNRR
jgi:hypothetical protein